ncbi:MAG TPA: class I SAM-dependent methyltransferase [Candidatus Babeliales bacterium]|nr:class I SAM-dependent methyltransferase [Candidatus Babeliales bacterium]
MDQDSSDAFDQLAERYDSWFDRHQAAFLSEIEAYKKVVPSSGEGLEVGVGSGRFAAALGIKTGIEPSDKLGSLAKARGINVFKGVAESLPFPDHQFDFVLFGTVLCYLEHPLQALLEAKRVLKPNGTLIIGMLDKNSKLCQSYEARKNENPFYRNAHFYTVNDVLMLLHEIHFKEKEIYQTIFAPLEDIKQPEPVKSGHGEGGYVIISAQPHYVDYVEP